MHTQVVTRAPRLKRRVKTKSKPFALLLQGADGAPCAYCDRPMIDHRFPTRDHKYPRHRGGSSTSDNIAIVCSPCNNEKGGMTLYEFMMYLADRGDHRAVLVRRHYKPTMATVFNRLRR